MATNTKTTDYQLHLKGFVGGYDFDADYVDYILNDLFRIPNKFDSTTTGFPFRSGRKTRSQET